MHIDKAIKELTEPSTWLKNNAAMDYLDAARLGAEALRQVKDCRSGEVLNPDFLLPGESKD